MNIIHFSFECYPVAKAGGLGDVVGALPKYLQKKGVDAWVVMPRYYNNWIIDRPFEVVHAGITVLGNEKLQFEVHKVTGDPLGYPLYLIHVPGLLDRPGIYVDPTSGYGYWDEFHRYLAFQVSALNWLNSFSWLPDVLHCHDHHTSLIPFMMTSCPAYDRLKSIPTVLTIHNGEYHGNYDMGKTHYFPQIYMEDIGYLEWGGRMNALAAGIRKCWKVTTVSQSYMQELQDSANGLEYLLRHEAQKSVGIINGIDDDVWDPATDPLINHNYSVKNVEKGKLANKKDLCDFFNLDPNRPMFAFIGRLVKEKGADLLPELISWFLSERQDASFVVLGTGDPWLHDRLKAMNAEFTGYFDTSIQYNEALSHKIYAGADFIMMPSRVEPCGLNQMYSMKYGTVPIVRSVGGLKDTVIDFETPGGYGVGFNSFSLEEAYIALNRAMKLYNDTKKMKQTRKLIMELDFSWDRSAQTYLDLYKSLN